MIYACFIFARCLLDRVNGVLINALAPLKNKASTALK